MFFTPTSNNLFYNMLGANVTANVCSWRPVKKLENFLTFIIHSLTEFDFVE